MCLRGNLCMFVVEGVREWDVYCDCNILLECTMWSERLLLTYGVHVFVSMVRWWGALYLIGALYMTIYSGNTTWLYHFVSMVTRGCIYILWQWGRVYCIQSWQSTTSSASAWPSFSLHYAYIERLPNYMYVLYHLARAFKFGMKKIICVYVGTHLPSASLSNSHSLWINKITTTKTQSLSPSCVGGGSFKFILVAMHECTLGLR